MKRIFKKYVDKRRIWDPTHKKYATIRDVMEAVLAGDEVEVLAIPSKENRLKGMMGEDITHDILVDALSMAEHVKPQLSVDELVALIRGRILQQKEE